MALIREATFPDDLDFVRRLFLAYRDTPGVAECVAGFEREVAGLPGSYAPPEGAILIASIDGAGAGCVALRPLGDGVCELKRLYVDPATRGTGAGRQLVLAAMNAARAKRYVSLRLDTLPSMGSAIALYRSLGFRKIDRYYASAPADALFFELTLPESVL